DVVRGWSDGKAGVWDTAKRGLPATLEHKETVLCTAISPDGKYIVTGSSDMNARVWQRETGKLLGDPIQHDGEVRYVQISPDSKTFATATVKGIAQIWNLPARTSRGKAITHKEVITSLSFGPEPLIQPRQQYPSHPPLGSPREALIDGVRRTQSDRAKRSRGAARRSRRERLGDVDRHRRRRWNGANLGWRRRPAFRAAPAQGACRRAGFFTE